MIEIAFSPVTIAAGAVLGAVWYEVEVFSTIPVSPPLPQSVTQAGAGRSDGGSHGRSQLVASLWQRKKDAGKQPPPGVSAGGFFHVQSGTKPRTRDPGGLTVAGNPWNTSSTTSAVRAAMISNIIGPTHLSFPCSDRSVKIKRC